MSKWTFDTRSAVSRMPVRQRGLIEVLSARPVARQIAAQGLGLADPGERLASGVRDQGTNPLQRPSVLFPPAEVSIPSVGDEAVPAHDQPPSASSKARGRASPA